MKQRSTGNAKPSPAWLLVLMAFAVLVCLRMPQIILKGRFWAEEGRFFFHNAWVLPPGQALLEPVGGYLNLVANGATLAARWLMPLRLAPYMTITVALLIQLLPPLLILTARDGWLRGPLTRISGVLLLLLVPASEEIWLQTLHCQFELTLCCGIILVLEPEAGLLGLLRLAILLLAPLCGPGAIALIPLFLLRLAGDRNAARLLQVVVLCLAAALQISLFLRSTPGRGFSLDPAVLLCIMTVRHLALPFLGGARAEGIAAAIRARLASGHTPHVATILPILVGGMLALMVAARPAPRPAFWLLAAALLIAVLSYFGAIGQATSLIDVRLGERYAFVPEALFSLALLALTVTTWRPLALLGWIAIAWQLTIGAQQFAHPWTLTSDGSAWRPQVAGWRLHPGQPLNLWPDGWTVTLEPTAHASAR